MDPDHARGGFTERRRGIPTPEELAARAGEPFPDGIAGARRDTRGFVRADAEVVEAAVRRADAAVAAATPGIPALGPAGDLPAGVHAASWDEFAARFAGTPRRTDLLAQLRASLDALRNAGIDRVAVGGSITSAKPVPGDVDVAWIDAPRGAATMPAPRAGAIDGKAAVAALGDVARDVHLYPASTLLFEAPTLTHAVPGSNVLEFFQMTRAGTPRGVVLLDTAVQAARLVR